MVVPLQGLAVPTDAGEAPFDRFDTGLPYHDRPGYRQDS